MKKVFVLALAVIALNSCNFTKQATTFYNEHCSESKVKFDSVNYVIVNCKDLYPTKEVKKVVSEAYVDFDVVGASLTAKVQPKDTLNPAKLIYQIQKALTK